MKGHVTKHAGSTKHHATKKKHHPAKAKKHHPAKVDPSVLAKAVEKVLADLHVHVVAKHPAHAKPTKKKASWSPNLDTACCAAEALAASLRLTGRTVDPQDVLDLYWRTAVHPDQGASLLETFEAAAEFGLAGVRLLDARPAQALATGVVLGVDLAERHAAVVDGHGVWTWGLWRPVSCGLLAAADEAWVITWL